MIVPVLAAVSMTWLLVTMMLSLPLLRMIAPDPVPLPALDRTLIETTFGDTSAAIVATELPAPDIALPIGINVRFLEQVPSAVK